MSQPSLSEIQSLLDQTDLAGLPRLGISVLRNVVVDPIVPYLRHGALSLGLNAEVSMGQFDNVVQESIAPPPGLLDAGTDCIVVFLRLEGLSWPLARALPSMAPQAVADETARVAALVAQVLQNVRRHSQAMILWAGFELPPRRAFGVLDAQLPAGQRRTINALNDAVTERLAEVGGAYFIDLNALVTEIGTVQFFDNRYWHIGRAPYTRAALALIARECMRFIAALKGKARKCLVLDCDNTLWGGVIGEDGLNGIQLGTTHPGSSFMEFQQEALNLYHRGILLALCSKNNADDVWEVFRNHPGMLLKEEHIAAAQINWDDKATNLRRIAEQLNIGIDSLVFADDSDFEIDLVRQSLPEVATLHLPRARSADARDALAGLGLFDGLTFSDEDRRRGEMYRAEAGRKQLAEQAVDMGAYLRSLEMRLEIRRAEDTTIARIAQLTQKTNQFNLTTRRYSEAEIAGLAAGPDTAVYSVQLTDRFGDYGIIGVMVLRSGGGAAEIDTLLLSCRALGRGVEEAMIDHAVGWAGQRGASRIDGAYIPTRKNGQVEQFYPHHGFSVDAAASGEGPQRRYVLDLSTAAAQTPAQFVGSLVSNF